MPIERLEFWKGIFEGLGVGLLGATFLVGLVFMLLSKKVNEHQTWRLRELELKLTQALAEQSKQQERAANAEKQLLEVQRRQQPRGLPSDMGSVLRRFPPVKAILRYQAGNPDAQMFAGLLRSSLANGGWEVSTPTEVASVTAAIKRHGGVLAEIIFVEPDLDNPGEGVKALREILSNGGLRVGAIRDDTMPKRTILILIGPKM